MTYSTLGYLLAAMTGVLLLLQVCFYKKICSSPELACVATVLQSTTLNVGVEIVIAISRIAVTLFFGSALFMSSSDSALVQIQASGIDSNTINTLVFNPIRYWKMGLSLIFFILAVRTLEKVRYFTIATSAMGGSDLDVITLLRSVSSSSNVLCSIVANYSSPPSWRCSSCLFR